LSRNAGVHAAGVVIADRDLSDYIPLCHDVKGNDVISQYAMGPLNDLGLLKMDFLGLKNADRHRGYADADSQTRPKLFAKRYSAE
jgi:DNA polymerase III alpha subunit